MPRQTDLICTPQRRAAMMPWAAYNGGSVRVLPRRSTTQCYKMDSQALMGPCWLAGVAGGGFRRAAGR